MPVRKIKPNTRSMTGRLACHRTGRSLDHESQLEKDCLLLFSSDPAVHEIEVQPVKISYQKPNARGRIRVHTYTPDILVHFHARLRRTPLLVEVKYCADLEKKRQELLPKIRAGRGYARRRGWRFRVYTERRIRGGNAVFLRNIKFLRPRLRELRDPAISSLLLTAASAQVRTTVAALLEACGGADAQCFRRLIPCLWRLVAAREIGADLSSQILSLTTPLWPHTNPAITEK